jgi:hypothetical protein
MSMHRKHDLFGRFTLPAELDDQRGRTSTSLEQEPTSHDQRVLSLLERIADH